MTNEHEPETLLCRHCGAILIVDEEQCRACGKLAFDVSSGRNISLKAIVSGGMASWLQDAIHQSNTKPHRRGPHVNPATGLPVKGGVDSAGNVVGRGGPWDDE